MERIVAICSTVVTRRTVWFISAVTRYGLFLHGIFAHTFSIFLSDSYSKVTRPERSNGTLCAARPMGTVLLLSERSY